MTTTEAAITLLHLSDKDLKRIGLPQLKNFLGMLRCVTRQLEREIIHREIQRQEHESILK